MAGGDKEKHIEAAEQIGIKPQEEDKSEQSTEDTDIAFEGFNINDLSAEKRDELLKLIEEGKSTHKSFESNDTYEKSFKTFMDKQFPRDKSMGQKTSKSGVLSSADSVVADFWYDYLRGEFAYQKPIPDEFKTNKIKNLEGEIIRLIDNVNTMNVKDKDAKIEAKGELLDKIGDYFELIAETYYIDRTRRYLRTKTVNWKERDDVLYSDTGSLPIGEKSHKEFTKVPKVQHDVPEYKSI